MKGRVILGVWFEPKCPKQILQCVLSDSLTTLPVHHLTTTISNIINRKWQHTLKLKSFQLNLMK